MRRLLALASILGLAACATTPVPRVASQAQLSPSQAYDVWDTVLVEYVDESGRVDFAGLKTDSTALDRFVAWVYTVGPNNQPALFPSSGDVLAYHINAYNALAMYAVLDAGIPKHLNLLDRARFFKLRSIRVGGEKTNLYDYENQVIRPIGDPRIHFAINCMAVSCPRLPQQAFRPATLEQELQAVSTEFFNDLKHVVVDHTTDTVKLSAILDFFPQDFLAVSPSLVAYANRYAEPKIPENYTVEFLPYDWTINTQP
ncbi:DUF547 domain-containing protein [bacterium]|nr:DUF547 domain-containing protein [bacterium]